VSTTAESSVTGRAVRFVVPEAIADPATVSGGNVYDLALRDGLTALGWDVRMVPAPLGERGMHAVLSDAPDGALVLVDGLLAGSAPDAFVRGSGRLSLVVLAHMVAASIASADERAEAAERERRAFDAARYIVATSAWTRDELLSEGVSRPGRVVVARPGTVASSAATGSPSGARLLCVGVVAPHKGQDLLLRALAGLDERPEWTCTFAGSVDLDPEFAGTLKELAAASGLADRVHFTGVLSRHELEEEYASTDLLVVPSRAESFGMAAAEALAHGIPVLATRVGGVPEAVSNSGAALLVPPGDPWALRVVLEQWCTDAARRRSLKAEAVQAMAGTRKWSETARIVDVALTDVLAGSDSTAGEEARRV
jgi:glycosyltransferase involved in cell wall biosynthesis